MAERCDLFKQNPASGRVRGPRIKICGITSRRDIELCTQIGVDALGFLVGHETLGLDGSVQGHRLSIERAKALVGAAPNQISSVLLIHQTSAEDMLALCRAILPDVIQVQKEVAPETLQEIRDNLPRIKIIKTFHVTPESTSDQVVSAVAAFRRSVAIDGVLLDSRRSASHHQTGGTGVTHDWSISEAVVRAFPDLQIVLAGGLRPQNLTEAISAVRPYAVDIMTGAESARGIKDYEAIRSIVSVVAAS